MNWVLPAVRSSNQAQSFVPLGDVGLDIREEGTIRGEQQPHVTKAGALRDCERLCVTQGGFSRCVSVLLAVSEEIVPAGIVLGGCPVFAPTSWAVVGATGEAREPWDTPFVDIRGLGGGGVRDEVTVSRKAGTFGQVCGNTFR